MEYSEQFNYNRRKCAEVKIGNLALGGDNPIRVQTMANTDTNDVEKSVEQCIRVIEAGSELMRYTTQGVREVESLKAIRTIVSERGCAIPLVADIHFNANAAMLAARYVEKVRINPGNFVGGIKKKGDCTDYTDAEFEQEYEVLKTQFVSFLNICKEHGTAIRIGVNHGSLSERMMNRYGDTSQGMVESCMELLRICREEDFGKVVISMKTSNTVFMVHTVRLLVQQMEKEGFYFPLHLGVTEAGDGEDGRIKSAVGIGALLADGIGDTIRVSLSEDPEFEIPVATALVDYVDNRKQHALIKGMEHLSYNRFQYERRETHAVKNIGGENPPVVIAIEKGSYPIAPDYYLENGKVVDANGGAYTVYENSDIIEIENDNSDLIFLQLQYGDLTPELLTLLYRKKNIVILLQTAHVNGVGEQRAFFHLLLNAGCTVPVVICRRYAESALGNLQIKAAADMGVMFIDGFGDGILPENEGVISSQSICSIAFGILQAARVRISKTEYISCPGCGRTLFNLQESIARVKERTSHLKGLKIAIMGCIVNGPGEMADADYGYVGAGRGRVSLYKKKECIERNIPEEEAVEKLLVLINKDRADKEM
ncbi:4-hydroxy-3-methylbut-2-en-1-yl diphosphate synthase [Paludibacter sp. 221]|uniref:(E)-4-hydroxy-3-methylbut-2-enyl-diphosphate synthase n=1 Tax=Paludibacter sp. 221 TaxID=2302939 RepID=UPI0013D25868|nr:(E)-4-hydroxy-3-methylbut-2-enyl-diphosphate synthase [Paludibacter sp. 221]NDV47489.1 4-hydroxy-3-methylbut-2-en-1-yl diphosphate synthase [Paludibacter sp. 221]